MPFNFNRYCGNSSRAGKSGRDSAIFPYRYKDAGRWFTRTSTDDAVGRGRLAGASADGWTFIFKCARVIRKLSSALSVNQLPDMALRNSRAVLVAYV